jgi:hypothetical protein
MHLEHIYAYNDKNKALFKEPSTGLFDEAGFEYTRNLLGMVLLLKDLQNISSGNDIYSLKRDDYAKSDIIWNQLLVGCLPSVDATILPEPFQKAAIDADTTGVFPREKVEQRQRLFFEAFKIIWADV